MKSKHAPAPAAARQGQLLGHKGSGTRHRLMEAARQFLRNESPVRLNAAAITKMVNTSPGTFYHYFTDVNDLVYALCLQVTGDIEDVLEVITAWRHDQNTAANAAKFVQTYRAYWDRHRDILSIRNMEADRGEARFLKMRLEGSLPLINGLASVLSIAHGEFTAQEARARAAVIFAAVDRLAGTSELYAVRRNTSNAPFTSDVLREAQISILTELMSPAKR